MASSLQKPVPIILTWRIQTNLQLTLERAAKQKTNVCIPLLTITAFVNEHLG